MHAISHWKARTGLLLTGAVLAVFASLSAESYADCHTHYTEALTLLNTATQQASANQHPNPDAFATDFKTMVSRLQTEKCMPEMMNLIQHIQEQQQKLPVPADPHGVKPAPDTE